jgi:photosystem I subunit III
MRRLFALVLAVCLWFSLAPVGSANAAVLTPCSESSAFIQRAKGATTPQAKARFDRYSEAMCGEEGLPHLVPDSRVGEFIIPGLMFLYIAGWIGWVGRMYIQAVKKMPNPTDKEIVIDVPLAIRCSLSGFAWPAAAFGELASGKLTAKDSEITVSPR